ncbi:DNA-binding domain-containing protein [Pseudomonas purpurea]|uniref:DNA-binding domain-containing protein n=1 Tax=Pseudomonas purpurea TaxID=3136737 RepID=UPI003267149F
MRLNEWQLAFEDFLLGEQSTANLSLGRSLIGGPPLDVETGLAIYHNAYQARLQEVLRGDFPTLWHWLGDDEFEALAAAYLRHSPSSNFSLRWLGKDFEAFIRQHLVPEYGGPLAELAALEWAFTLAFDAPDHAALTLQTMASLPPADWPLLQVSLRPCVQWLECRHNSVALWRAVKDEADFPESLLLDSPQVCLIWRAELVCHYRSLSAAEADALNGMANLGWNFAELCAELAVIYGEGAPLQAVTWLKQWVQDGLLARRESLGEEGKSLAC